MEGKYTKISAVVGVFALLLAIYQVYPRSHEDYSGEWNMTSKVEQAQLSNYIGMEIVWRLHLVQNGNQLQGTAEKISVNSKELDFNTRSSLYFNGTLEGS